MSDDREHRTGGLVHVSTVQKPHEASHNKELPAH